MLIELFAGNYNIEDGIVNSADGIFRTYTRNKNELDIMWIEFVDPTIGRRQRKRFNELYDKDFKSTWKPIMRIAKSLSTTSNKS